MNFEMIKKNGVEEVVVEIGENDNNLHKLNQDEINYIRKYWKIDINAINENNYKDYVDESDNSGNTIGRKIIWYYIKHIFSPLKNIRRIRNIIRRLRTN